MWGVFDEGRAVHSLLRVSLNITLKAIQLDSNDNDPPPAN